MSGCKGTCNQFYICRVLHTVAHPNFLSLELLLFCIIMGLHSKLCYYSMSWWFWKLNEVWTLFSRFNQYCWIRCRLSLTDAVDNNYIVVLDVVFSNSLIIQTVISLLECPILVRCMYLDTQWKSRSRLLRLVQNLMKILIETL